MHLQLRYVIIVGYKPTFKNACDHFLLHPGELPLFHLLAICLHGGLWRPNLIDDMPVECQALLTYCQKHQYAMLYIPP